MRIGVDAKRIFLNATGLGNYGRTLLDTLAMTFPEESYWLFTPRVTGRWSPPAGAAATVVTPQGGALRCLPWLWRSAFVAEAAAARGVGLYHGLSGELPLGIRRTGIRTVVTVHDVIFERYPAQYSPVDCRIYRAKTRYACCEADRIIAVSDETKRDLVHYYDVDPRRIVVVYQGCDPRFARPVSAEAQWRTRAFYGLPETFFLYVGSVIPRKNLLGIVRALARAPGLPSLAVVGTGKRYAREVKRYIASRGLEARVHWLSERAPVSSDELAVLYRMATALVYPSLCEGYGIPLQEAMAGGTPVITTDGPPFRETAGDGALYADPADAGSLARAMELLFRQERLREVLSAAGRRQAVAQSARLSALGTMRIYRELLGEAANKKPARSRLVL